MKEQPDNTVATASQPVEKSTAFFRGTLIEKHSIRAFSRFKDNLGNASTPLLTAGRFGAYDNTLFETDTTSRSLDEVEFPCVPNPENIAVQEPIVSLQKWEGNVLEVNGTSFFARLRDINDKISKEDAEFSKSAVSRDDLPLLKSGAVFYWSIGFHTDMTGRQRTISEIRFRRLPGPTPAEYEEAKREAKEIAKALGMESTREERSES